MLTRIGLLSAGLAACASAGDHYLVRTRSADIGDVAARYGLTVIRTLGGPGRNLASVDIPVGLDVKQLALDPAVASVEPDSQLSLPETAPMASLNASSQVSGLERPAVINFFGSQVLAAYVSQPAASVIALDGARTLNATGAGIVAVLDTGVDPRNPVLRKSLVQGYDFVHNAPGGSEMTDLDQSTTAILDDLQSTTAILDKTETVVLNQSTTAILDQSTTAILDIAGLPAAFGHGTMVAGLVHLVAPTASIMPVKVFASDGTSTLSRIVDGIYWAVDHGANVINMSFDTQDDSPEMENAINYAISKGVICVASAGNEGKHMMVYPAGYGIIGVGSTNNLLVRSSFSNFGSAVVTLAAPGEGVITLYPGNNYAAGWGTSFSAPLVAGGAALLLQLGANTGESQAAQALSQAVPIGQQLGAGELDLLLACLYRATNQ